MRYDGSNSLHAAQARLKLEKLISEGRIFDLTEKKPPRTLRQNSYLWAALAYWGLQTGYTKDEAEAWYKDINRDIYRRQKQIAGTTVDYIRHTYELDTAEMSLTIDRFRNRAAAEGIYIPSPDDHRLVQLMEMEVERNKQYL